jgi:AcrR family transcriptional regulator
MAPVAATPQHAPRSERRRDLVSAARRLFDERGMQEAPIETIARDVGIARGLVYREFASKDELFALTVTSYLDELAEILEAAIGAVNGPVSRLEACTHAYGGYCERFPAFLDCSLSLMRQPARELRETVSEAVWLRLGQGMIRCIDQLAQILRDGRDDGTFAVEDPDYLANVLWTQMLGAMHLARLGIGLRNLAPGMPGVFTVAADDVVRTSVASAMATVGATHT